jgi:hypothetical protein
MDVEAQPIFAKQPGLDGSPVPDGQRRYLISGACSRVRDIEAAGREVALRRKGLVPRTLRPIAATERCATPVGPRDARYGIAALRTPSDQSGVAATQAPFGSKT